MTKKELGLADLFQDYSDFHRSLANQITHWIGIPSIMLSLLGLLSHLGSGHFNCGLALWASTTLWYILLNWKIGAPFSLVTLGIYMVGTVISPLCLGILFATGWAFQLGGHSYFEKNRPALLTNIRHMLIGPLWLYAKLIRYY